VNPDLALNLEALANDVGEVIENFGEVAAGFALQHDGGDEEFYVDERDTLGEVHEGIANGHAELLLFKEFAELGGERVGDFVGNHFEGGSEGMTGADGAGESVDGLGKKLLKFLKALLAR